MTDFEENDFIEKIREQIVKMPKTIRVGQQNKHIEGTHEFNQYVSKLKAAGEYGPSILSGDIGFAQDLVNEYAGTGEPIIRNKKWMNAERILADRIVGVSVNNMTSSRADTKKFKIHYSNKGTHIVPDYPN
jgi:hypothetical protein